ncbi:hypothetical protein FACS189444_2040 [Spirochaetia bacterium]|nr:hypothetical protein FACS189444_2040 [Spirochaetia bacterium]
MTLYIIGNGFDLKHGLLTSYNKFHEFLEKQNQQELLDYFSNYFGLTNDWSDFENMLGKPNVKEILGDESDLIADDDEEGSSTHTFSAKIDQITELLTNGLRVQLNNWINTINPAIKNQKKIDIFDFNIDDYYLTFNYTKTLEELYKINPDNICHIHGIGKVIRCRPGDIPDDPSIVIGHSFDGIPDMPKMNNYGKPKSYLSYYEGILAIEEYFHKSYKYTELIMKERDNKLFFDKYFLKDIDAINIIGHSLSNVDIQYFKEIAKNMKQNITYNITYYGPNEKNKIINNSKFFIGNNAVNYIDIK